MFEDYNWFGFAIAFTLLVIVPVWVIRIFDMSIFIKLALTVILGLITFVAVKTGGTKKGLVSR